MLAVMTLLDIGVATPDWQLITLSRKDWNGIFWTDLPPERHYPYLLFLAFPAEPRLRGYFPPGYGIAESKGKYRVKFKNKHNYSFVY
jgi:hypothetical protein